MTRIIYFNEKITQAASSMIHLMAVGIWIWGSSFLFPQALIPVNSGW